MNEDAERCGSGVAGILVSLRCRGTPYTLDSDKWFLRYADSCFRFASLFFGGRILKTVRFFNVSDGRFSSEGEVGLGLRVDRSLAYILLDFVFLPPKRHQSVDVP